MELVDKVREIYNIIDERGLYIISDNDIMFDSERTLSLNSNGSESIEIGKESYNSTLLFSILCGVLEGKMILYGPPGAGKTTTSELVGHFIYGMDLDAIQTATIYGHPEQTKEEMIARPHIGELMAGEEVIVKREFMDSPVGIIDEMPRLPPGKLSILYQLVDRGFCKVASEIVRKVPGPIYMTANASDSGSYPVPLPFLDRIDLATVTPHMNPFHIPGFEATEYSEKLLEIPEEVKINPETDLEKIREQINNIKIDPEVLYKTMVFISELNYCDLAGETIDKKNKGNLLYKKPSQGLCEKCHYKSFNGHICGATDNSISPRTYQSILKYGRALAWWRGKEVVSQEEMKQIIPYTCWHKLDLTKRFLAENQVYINDRISGVKHLYDKSCQISEGMDETLKEYDGAINLISKALDGEKIDIKKLEITVASQIENLQQVDSVTKFALASCLSNLYKTLKNGIRTTN
jgi:MoxR-like ATPase